MSKENQEQLASRINAAAKQVKIGDRYIHSRSPEESYKVIALALREEDAEPCVIYQAEYGAKIIFTRLVSSWTEEVDLDGAKIKRFTRI